MSSSSTRENLVTQVRDHFRRGDEMIAIHYACENFYEKLEHPPAISCIGYAPVIQGNAGIFSVIDAVEADPEDAERWVLKQYFEFVQKYSSAILIHWNMNRSDYGFAALDARHRFLFKEDPPYAVPADRTFDLDDLVAIEHGPYYVEHPKLMQLAAMNHLSRRHALTGKDEADRFSNGDHGSVRRSIDEKVRWISVLAEQFLAGALITERSVGSVRFAGARLDAVQTVLELARRMRDVHRELSRRHQSRSTIELNDEYDDQDFLRSLLRIFFEDVRAEDFVPSQAGANSRVDFLLPDVSLGVELKHTRQGLDAKKLGEELIVDIDRYSKRADIRHLVCIVSDYDGHLANPRGLEGDLSRQPIGGVGVTVVILDR